MRLYSPYFLLICLTFLSTRNSEGQEWNNYVGSKVVYEADIFGDSLILATQYVAIAHDLSTGNSTELSPDTALGFPNHSISVAIESPSKLWVAKSSGDAGLHLYQNGNWTKYDTTNSPLLCSDIENLYHNRESNNLWVDDGLYKFLKQGDEFINIGPYQGRCVERDGVLWIARGNQGLVRYADENITVYDTLNTPFDYPSFYNVAVDDLGAVWFDATEFDTLTQTSTSFIGSFDGENWNQYTSENSNLPSNIDIALKMQIDDNNNLICVSGEKMYEFDGMDFTLYSPSLGNFPEIIIRDLDIDASGNRYISTYNNGLLKWSNGDIETVDARVNPLVGNFAHSVLVDDSGYTWMAVRSEQFGSTNQGIFRYLNGTWESFEDDENCPGSAGVIEKDDGGNIYTFGIEGLHRYDGQNWSMIGSNTDPDSFVSDYDMAIDNQGKVWVVNNDTTIEIYGDNTYEVLPAPFVGGLDDLNCIEIDDDGNVWVGRYQYIHKYASGIWTTYDASSNAGNLGHIRDIKSDPDGNLWAASSALFKLNENDEWDYITPTPFIGSLTDIEIDSDGGIWVGANAAAISRYYDNQWVTFEESAQIYTDWVSDLSIDNENQKVWAATRGGGVFTYHNDFLLNVEEQLAESIKITLYPNPAIDRVSAKGISGSIENITIYTLDGKMVRSGVNFDTSSDQFNIDVSNLDTGVYLVVFEGKEETFVSRLLKAD